MQDPKPKRIDPAPATEIANDDHNEAAYHEKRYSEMQNEDGISQ